MKRWHRVRDDRGVSTVLLALLLPVILGVQALTIDVTRMFVERRELQNAVDAAALAAAAYLPGADAAVLARAREAAMAYALLNGVPIAEADVVFSTDIQPNDRVQVSAQADVTFAFARTFGLTSGTVRAQSIAQVGQLGGMLGILPLGIVPPADGLQMGEAYCLTLKSSGNPNACPDANEGDFHGIDIDAEGNNSASIYRGRIATGSLTTVHVGDVRGVLPGNMNNPTRQGFDDRLGSNTDDFSDVIQESDDCEEEEEDCLYQVLDWGSPRIGLVPIIDYDNSTGTILGFAVFFIESNPGNGNVVGRFINTLVPGGEWAPLGSSSYGTHVVRLTQ